MLIHAPLKHLRVILHIINYSYFQFYFMYVFVRLFLVCQCLFKLYIFFVSVYGFRALLFNAFNTILNKSFYFSFYLVVIFIDFITLFLFYPYQKHINNFKIMHDLYKAFFNATQFNSVLFPDYVIFDNDHITNADINELVTESSPCNV